MLKILEVVAEEHTVKIKMINKNKNKLEESLINNLKLLWNLVNSLLVVSFNSKFLIEKQVSMEILSIITVYCSQQKVAWLILFKIDFL
jgi:hypothetical protein